MFKAQSSTFISASPLWISFSKWLILAQTFEIENVQYDCYAGETLNSTFRDTKQHLLIDTPI